MNGLGLQFGLVIAYLIPGFLGVYALAWRVEVIQALLGGADKVPKGEAIVPLVLIALATGVVINAIAWALVRPLIALSGVRRPRNLDYTKLRADDLPVYNAIVENNFRYHQFYVNMWIAVLVLAPVWLRAPVSSNLARNISFFVVLVILFLAARDSLDRAYRRMMALQKKGETK